MLNPGLRAAAAGFEVEQVAAIASTNAELVARARAGVAGPIWLVADEQTAGRGRMARDWSSPPGNLYTSLLLVNPAPPALLHQLSFVCALALLDAVSTSGGTSVPLTLKWPNDLMAGGRKTAGLLLEGGVVAGGVPFVVAGFGVNIVSHPASTAHPATDLSTSGYGGGRDALFAALTDTVAEGLAAWARGDGFAAVRSRWLASAHGIGQKLRVTTRQHSFVGRFMTIDEGGRLIVDVGGTHEAVSAGEVFVLEDQSGEAA